MDEIVRFHTNAGTPLLVEVEDDSFGLERVARDDKGVIEASQRLDEALERAQPTIRSVVGALRELAPDEHEVEFGIKLNAEAGVVVAKTAVEGHFNVKLTWKSSTAKG